MKQKHIFPGNTQTQKCCGVIPYRLRDGVKEYLVLQQISGSWSFPKGHAIQGESEVQTALRELREESGLQAELQPNAKAVVEYRITPTVMKRLTLFTGQVRGNIRLQTQEITAHRWVTAQELPYFIHVNTLEACKDIL